LQEGVVSNLYAFPLGEQGKLACTPPRRPGANLNALLDEILRDPLSGNAVLSGVPVRLEPETADREHEPRSSPGPHVRAERRVQ